MENIRNYLKSRILVADGAAGTYISSLAGRDYGFCELLNLSAPEAVLRMHRQYINAGARLIFTNTFGASHAGNSVGKSFSTTKNIIREGVKIALEAADDRAFVAADIGPLQETSFAPDFLLAEYKRIADAFIDCGIKIFAFETFANSYYPVKISKYIKDIVPDAFIIVSFAVSPDGFSRENISGQRLINEIAEADCADSAGFNCCSGPAHLLRFAKTVDYKNLIPIIMPNAGYPQREAAELPVAETDVSYSGSPEYFASKLSSAAKSGFKIIGGCCGTTPSHIKMLSDTVLNFELPQSGICNSSESCEVKSRSLNAFSKMLFNNSHKAVIVELEPPFDTNIAKIEESAKTLMEAGVDAITVADSPMARARADSLLTAARLKRNIGVEVIPHLCCRDKNLNAIKSSLIAAHIEGVRNILAVTGDPIPDTDKGLVKGVFNMNSVGLCRFIRSLNSELFQGDEIFYGCAFNVNAKNINAEISKLENKIKSGASFVLTQPIFTDEAISALEKLKGRGIKVIAGLMTPVNYKNAVFLANEMPGFKIPEKYLRRFSLDMTREEGENEGIKITIEIAQKIAEIADGFYFVVPFNRASVTTRIIKALRDNGTI